MEFPVSVTWGGDGKRVTARVVGKAPIEIATPPEFEGGVAGVWSPEDFLVASAASCLGVTLVGIAAKSRVPLHALEIDAVGEVAKRDADGKLAFTDVRLHVRAATDEEHVAGLRKAIDRAERHCLVGLSLAAPVRVDAAVSVTAASAA